MQIQSSPPWREAPVPIIPPQCVIVTGPRGAGKARWLQLQIRDLAAKRPGASFAFLIAEKGHTRMGNFAQQAVHVRHALRFPRPPQPAVIGVVK
jgi:hypothetical protein